MSALATSASSRPMAASPSSAAWATCCGRRGPVASFTFLSRMGDVLRLSGFLVNPLEIETHVQKLPGIDGCQTIAVARPEGVRAVSFVTLKPGAALDEAGVIAHCKRGLANYK